MKPETTTRAGLLSVVVPVYDEAELLGASLRTLTAHLEQLGHPFELVCVDDGSRDGSDSILAAAAAADPRVRPIHFISNRGKGFAVRAGVLAAYGQRILFTDADLSTDLSATEAVLNELERTPIVFASRRAPGASIEQPQGLNRRVLGRGFSLLATCAAVHRMRDVTCGFKAFTRAAARDLFSLARTNGWAFDAEILAIAAARGWAVTELGVPWRDVGASKVRVPAAVARSVPDLALIAARRYSGAWSRKPSRERARTSTPGAHLRT